MKSEPGWLIVNMDQFRVKARIDSDTVLMHERITETGGKFYTLDARHYMEWLNQIGVFYRFTPDNRKSFVV